MLCDAAYRASSRRLDSSVSVVQLGGQFLFREIRSRTSIYVDEKPENATHRNIPKAMLVSVM